jgi:hypothetical protein
LNELIKVFEESVLEDSKIIRNGSIVALRHIATGKYLSGCNKKYPKVNMFYKKIFPRKVI